MISFSLFIVLGALGVSLGIALGLTGLAYFISTGAPAASIAFTMLNQVKAYVLVSVPLYLFAGIIMNVSGVTQSLFEFAEVLVGRFRGGLAQVNIVNSIIFSGMSGSAVADAGGVGAMEIAAMRQHKYPDWLTMGITASSSILAPIIPPSIVLVLYGAIADVSIAALFLAGILPGLVIAGCLMIAVYFLSFHPSVPLPNSKFTLRDFPVAFKKAFLPMMTPVIILGGIFSGLYTPTEGAAMASGYALVLWIFVYKTFTWAALAEVARQIVKITGAVLFIAATAALVGLLATESQISGQVLAFLKSITDDKTMLLVYISIVLFVVGMFLDTISAYYLVTPVLLPILKVYDIDLVHFGIVITVNLMIGVLTPPVGQVLFVLSSMTNTPLEKMSAYVVPFIIPIIVALGFIIAFPQISLFIPRAVLG
jgi:tripartite ATP-independent transporter DctM subunit